MEAVTVSAVLSGYLLFGLTLLRCSGLVVFAPFFGADHFPMPARVAIALLLAVTLYPAAKANVSLPETIDAAELALLALQELSIGLVLGFFATFVFMGAQLAGELAGTQIGFSMANIIDPLLGEEVSLIGFLKMNLAMVVFLTLKLHLLVIAVLHASFGYVGIGSLVFETFYRVSHEAAILNATDMVVVALKLSMPVLLVMMLNSLIEGVVTRTMPQMNIMVLGLPLRVALGMGVFVLVLPAMAQAMDGMFWDMLYNLDEMVRALGM